MRCGDDKARLCRDKSFSGSSDYYIIRSVEEKVSWFFHPIHSLCPVHKLVWSETLFPTKASDYQVRFDSARTADGKILTGWTGRQAEMVVMSAREIDKRSLNTRREKESN